VAETSCATSRSAVSRGFVALVQTAPAELFSRDLPGLDVVVQMIDTVHFGESCCVVAPGVSIGGVKHPVALVASSTENATRA
jgi:putative transposase